MRKSLCTTLCVSALCFGLLVQAANATRNVRTTGFTFVCDGLSKQTTVAFGGFPANQIIQVGPGQINLFQHQGGLQYVILGVPQTVITLAVLAGGGDPTDHGSNNSIPISGLSFGVVVDPNGIVRFTILGSCVGGAGQISGLATFYFPD